MRSSKRITSTKEVFFTLQLNVPCSGPGNPNPSVTSVSVGNPSPKMRIGILLDCFQRRSPRDGMGRDGGKRTCRSSRDGTGRVAGKGACCWTPRVPLLLPIQNAWYVQTIFFGTPPYPNWYALTLRTPYHNTANILGDVQWTLGLLSRGVKQTHSVRIKTKAVADKRYTLPIKGTPHHKRCQKEACSNTKVTAE